MELSLVIKVALAKYSDCNRLSLNIPMIPKTNFHPGYLRFHLPVDLRTRDWIEIYTGIFSRTLNWAIPDLKAAPSLLMRDLPPAQHSCLSEGSRLSRGFWSWKPRSHHDCSYPQVLACVPLKTVVCLLEYLPPVFLSHPQAQVADPNLGHGSQSNSRLLISSF